MKKLFLLLFLMPFLACSSSTQTKSNDGKIIVAYVAGWRDSVATVDPQYMTHINFAFGNVSETFDGISIPRPENLRRVVALKKQKPELKIMLSIGGWGSGRFSEMAADRTNRESFADDCKRVIDEFGLDGVDLDWEYPTSSSADISSSPDDTENFTLLVRDIRQRIGPDKLLTLASDKSAKYFDFRAIDPYMDFVNIMTYDMGNSPMHHSAMYRSDMTGWFSCEESIQAHLDAGVPVEKLVFGMPFYGRGQSELSSGVIYGDIIKLEGYTEEWDDVAQAPYMKNAAGETLNYDSPRSIALKCDYIYEKGMKGAMYWEYSGDDEQGTLRKAVYDGVLNRTN